MNVLSIATTTRLLQAGLDALTAVLLTVVAVSVRSDPAALALTIAFAGLYLIGRLSFKPAKASILEIRGRSWPENGWLIGLSLLWWALLVTAGTPAIWLAFPLTLLQMHILGPHRGVLAVAATTIAAVSTGLLLGLDPLGSVLGPTLGGALAIGVVLGLEAMLRETERRQELIDDLLATREQLASVEHDRGIMAERERLAREIHDTLAQGLSSIELLLRVAEETGDYSQVRPAREVALANLAEVRQLVRGLAPADLTESTLQDALARIASRTTGVQVNFTVTGDSRELPVTTSAELVRITQSTLANVTRHAQASRANLTLTFLPDSVLLDIVDDGVGFDPNSAGFGLTVLKDRVAAIGGKVTIESAPGAGTAVAVEVPS
ncbi:MAG TPA: sensor histidine kinase [Aeromicrobium sp.]|nr:sensor histidine kinase [Aeromicrobium sp.]